MPVRSPLLLAALLALLAPAAASQPAVVPTPTRVTAPGAGAYADVYPDGVAAARHLSGNRPAEASAPSLTLDVGEGPEADFLQDVAFTPSGDRIVTANAQSNNVAVVDAATGVTLAVVPVGQ